MWEKGVKVNIHSCIAIWNRIAGSDNSTWLDYRLVTIRGFQGYMQTECLINSNSK